MSERKDSDFEESNAIKDAEPVFVVYGAGANQLPVIEACQRRGWKVVAIDRNPEALGEARADRFICASLRDHDQIISALRPHEIRGVAARVTDQIALESSQRLATDRGVPSACPALVAAATSKIELATVCRRAQLRTPRRLTANEKVDWRTGPVILRPDITLRGKAGIHRVENQAEMNRRRLEAEAASANGRADISQWVDGVDLSVLVQLDRGSAKRIAIWDEWVALTEQGQITGVGAGFPSVHNGALGAVDATLDALASEFTQSRCLVTLSLRVDRLGQVWIIEIHLGVGGDGLADQLIPAALPGFNAFDALVSVCAGEILEAPPTSPRPRGLVPGKADWQLIEAPDAETLRAKGRARISPSWELPFALRASKKALAIIQPAAPPRPGWPPPQ